MHIIMQTMKTDYGRKSWGLVFVKGADSLRWLQQTDSSACKSEEVPLALCGWQLCCPGYQQQGANGEPSSKTVSFPATPTHRTSTKAKKPRRPSLAGVLLLIQRPRWLQRGGRCWPCVCADDWKPEILAEGLPAVPAPTQAAGNQSFLCFWFLPFFMQGSVLFWLVVQKHELAVIR